MLLAAFLALAAAAQSPAAASPAAERAARYEQLYKDSGNSALLWLIAEAHAEAGAADQTVAYVKQVADRRLGFQVMPDSPLAKLRGRADFDALSARLDSEGRVAGGSRELMRLSTKGLVPEGIAADAPGETFFVGDMAGRRILVLSRGEERAFAQTGAMQPLGIKVSPDGTLLWVAASNAFLAAVEEPQSALLAFDIETGKQVDSVSSPELKSINDLDFLPNGDIYVTDSLGGAVFRRAGGAATLERVTPASQMSYPNGIAARPDGSAVYVAQGVSLRRIDTATGTVTSVKHGPELALVSLDGLYWHQGDLVAVQNSGGRGRVLRLQLNDAGDAITAHTVLEAAHPLFDIPTTGTIVASNLVVIANSQLDQIQDDGSVEGLLNPVVLLNVPLDRRN